MVNAKKFNVPDIQPFGFIIEILNDDQKPIQGAGFSVYVDGIGMSMETDKDGLIKIPIPKNEIQLTLVSEVFSATKSDKKIPIPLRNPKHGAPKPVKSSETLGTPSPTYTPEETTKKKIPIIIVPGIMGTRLTDPQSGKMVWNPVGYPVHDAHPIVAEDDRLAQIDQPLQPDETHTYPVAHKDFTRAYKIPHFYNLVADFYDELAFAMSEKLPESQFKTYACGYDWRQDNANSAQRLANIVEEALKENSANQVIIIAHSMGGLVSRYYCKELGGEAKVRALFLIGSPTYGSPKAYRMLKQGLDWWNDKKMGFILRMGEDSRHMIHRFQSTYQLLPSLTYLQNNRGWLSFNAELAKISIDTTDPEILYKNDWTGIHEIIDPDWEQEMCKRNVTNAIDFHMKIKDYKPPNTYLVINQITDTEGKYYLKWYTNKCKKTADGRAWFPKEVQVKEKIGGDGTVPAFSANAFSDCNYEAKGVKHDELSNDPGVINYLVSKIKSLGGQTNV